MENTQVEVIKSDGEASGPVATAMMSLYDGVQFNVSKYRKLESLPERAWNYIDDALIRVAREELIGVADLNSRPGLSVNFDGMSASLYTRERISEMGAASIAVSPDTVADAGRVIMDDISVPLMVTYKDFFINTKRMAMAARVGLPLQLATVEEATRSVARHLENTLFNGNWRARGHNIYGYTTFPDRNRKGITTWSTKDPEDILADVIDMMEDSMKANHFGPWIMYIPWQYRSILQRDYTVGATPVSTNRSIEARLLELQGLEAVKVSNYLADDNVLLVEMSSSTVQMINGMPMRAVQWEAPGSPNWEHKFKVLTMAVPFLISDYEGNCGVTHHWVGGP